jgi:hypothetical protein
MPQTDKPASTVPPAPERKTVDDSPVSQSIWDNPKNAPHQRKSIRHDPQGLKNRELL